jgi:hypothetical protein
VRFVLIAVACCCALAGTALAHPADSAVDPDHDGVLTPNDNCPDTTNQTPADLDRDGQGDVCDDDDDGDRIDDATDNCRVAANPDQHDPDQDGDGDACDADDDGDSVVDSKDNCPSAFNQSQADSDSDGKGDICDAAPAAGSGGGTAGGGSLARVAVAHNQALSQLLAGGLAVAVRCFQACGIATELSADAASARALGLGKRRTLARSTWTLGGAARTWVFLEPLFPVRGKLRRARAVSATLTTTVTDSAGARRRIAAKVVFRR